MITTAIGFKRSVNKANPLSKGNERAFIICSRCKMPAYYDYVPYSLSNPIRTTPCGHLFSEYKALKKGMKIKKQPIYEPNT
jgi:hypothetical protein